MLSKLIIVNLLNKLFLRDLILKTNVTHDIINNKFIWKHGEYKRPLIGSKSSLSWAPLYTLKNVEIKGVCAYFQKITLTVPLSV